MKQSNAIFRIIMIVLFIGALAYFGVYLWNTVNAEASTATIYTYTAEEILEVNGYFFRDEQVLSERSDLAEALAAEGERVGSGDVLARIYRSSDGYAIQQQLDEAVAARDSLYYIRSRGNAMADAAALDDEIVSSFTSLRHQVAMGELSELSQSTGTLKSLIFRRDYSENSASTLDERIEAAEAEVSRLSAQASSAYTNVLSPASGLYSSTLDGYEGVMTVDALDDITPTRLASLTGRQKEVAEDGVGKIITSNGWYFACNVKKADASKLYRGATVSLRFEDANRLFTAKVHSVSGEQEGLITVVFYSQRYSSQVTAMRMQSCEIVTGSATGFRVPKRAVRVSEDGTLGVYRVSGARAEWINVDLLWEEDDYYLIRRSAAVDAEGNPVEESTFQRASNLRDGDSIIVRGGDIHGGKVVLD